MILAFCPNCCRLNFNSAATRPEHQPRPEDLTICDTCGTLLSFTADMQPWLVNTVISAAPAVPAKLSAPASAAPAIRPDARAL